MHDSLINTSTIQSHRGAETFRKRPMDTIKFDNPTTSQSMTNDDINPF